MSDPSTPSEQTVHPLTPERQLEIITAVLRRPVPSLEHPADFIVGATLNQINRSEGAESQPWRMAAVTVAHNIHTALLHANRSPLELAEDAKARRNLIDEVAALTAGDQALTGAAWYPVRAGDIVHVHIEPVGTMPGDSEAYLVTAHDGGFLALRLLAASNPEGACYETSPTDDPLYDLWFEAGAHRLTVVRDGRVVHNGPGGV